MGFVLFVRKKNVDDKTLDKVAAALGIPKSDHGLIISKTGNLYTYPGTKRGKKRGKKRSPSGGDKT